MASEVMSIIFLGLNILEIGLHAVAYGIVGFCLLVLVNNPVFHPHLIRIYKWVFISYFLSQLMRLAIVIERFTEDTRDESFNYYLINTSTLMLTIVSTLRLYFMISMYTGLIISIFERVLATIWLETYEQRTSFKFSLVCLFILVFSPAAGTYIIYEKYLDFIYCGIIVFICNVVGYLILSFLHCFNARRYRSASNTYTLSERFQLQENLRTAVRIKQISLIIFVLNGFIGAALLASKFFKTADVRKIAYIVLNYTILFYGFTFPLFGITANNYSRTLFNRLKSPLRNSGTKITPASNVPVAKPLQRVQQQVRSFHGNQMIFTADEERQLYFQQLQNTWN